LIETLNSRFGPVDQLLIAALLGT